MTQKKLHNNYKYILTYFFYYYKMNNNSIYSTTTTEIIDDRLTLDTNKNQTFRFLNFLPVSFNRNNHNNNDSFTSLDFDSIVILNDSLVSEPLINKKKIIICIHTILFLHLILFIMIFYYLIT